MKRILLLIFLLPSLAMAQSFKTDLDTKSSFTDQPALLLDTVAISSLKKQQLFSNALNYVSKSFKDSRNVLEMKDAELGEVLFNGRISFDFVDTATVTKTVKKQNIQTKEQREISSFLVFKCKVYVKDEKFKVVLYGLKTPMFYFSQEELQSTLREEDYKMYNKTAKLVALDYIKSVSEFLNRKPENDF